jgi:hypothetical protein
VYEQGPGLLQEGETRLGPSVRGARRGRPIGSVWIIRRRSPDSDSGNDQDPVIALWRRRAEEVQAAVKAKVKPHTWEAFWLLAVRGCDMEETVKMLGISHFSAFKAKERVSRQLKDEGRRRYGAELD